MVKKGLAALASYASKDHDDSYLSKYETVSKFAITTPKLLISTFFVAGSPVLINLKYRL
jgi:hypothetical protein